MEKQQVANIKRLTRMADLLEEEVERGFYDFDLYNWGCDTTGCAVGLAVASGIFAREGLSMAGPTSFGSRGSKNTPVFDGEEGWKAVSKFFVLSLDDTMHFFCAYHFAKKEGPEAALEVARRIREKIAVWSPSPAAVVDIKELEPA